MTLDLHILPKRVLFFHDIMAQQELLRKDVIFCYACCFVGLVSTLLLYFSKSYNNWFLLIPAVTLSYVIGFVINLLLDIDVYVGCNAMDCKNSIEDIKSHVNRCLSASYIEKVYNTSFTSATSRRDLV